MTEFEFEKWYEGRKSMHDEIIDTLENVINEYRRKSWKYDKFTYALIMDTIKHIDISKMEKLMTNEIQETLKRTCELADVAYHGKMVGAGHTIPAKDLRYATEDELKDICAYNSEILSAYLKEFMEREGN